MFVFSIIQYIISLKHTKNTLKIPLFDIYIVNKLLYNSKKQGGLIGIFNNDFLLIEIIDVFHDNRTKSKYHTPNRPFHILTKRVSGYTDMIFQNQSFRIGSDSLMYIPANTEYLRQSYDDEEIIAVHFNILNCDSSAPCLIKVDSDECNRVFSEIYNLWTEKKKGYKYKCTAVLNEYLSEIVVGDNYSEDYYKLQNSVEYIKNNLSQKITVGELAKLSNLCESQYRKLFKKEFSMSPINYINKMRINSAVIKLSSGNYSMSQIAELCGFSEQKYFNKIFKEHTGKSPSQYKKEYL